MKSTSNHSWYVSKCVISRPYDLTKFEDDLKKTDFSIEQTDRIITNHNKQQKPGS